MRSRDLPAARLTLDRDHLQDEVCVNNRHLHVHFAWGKLARRNNIHREHPPVWFYGPLNNRREDEHDVGNGKRKVATLQDIGRCRRYFSSWSSMEVTREDPRLGEISEGAGDISRDSLVWRLLVKIHDLARYRKVQAIFLEIV
ncbi:hypothetical protein RRG08_007688 [Elysia crispata]|uniref:Uncharacterized protein n=1 Tax=Elysia crispata TaxID=231223 RepID=A0AAE1D505_9GAST|nr:hypothetical protein RRG08_007688 [Elysia crispata]